MVDPIEGYQANTGESVLRIRLDNLNRIATERQQDNSGISAYEANRDGKQSSSNSSGTRDSVSITREASVIADSGLDVSQSTIRKNGDKIEFNLRFANDKFSTLTTKGSYTPASKDMDLFVSFNFQDNIKTDKGTEARTLNAKAKIQASNVTPETFSQLEGHGGNLVNMIDNMLGRMLERAYSKQYPPNSIVLKLDDIADLVSEKGGIFQKVSRAMMLLNNTLARALQGGSTDEQTLNQVVANAANPDGSIELKDFSFQLTDVTPTLGPTPLGSGSGSETVEPVVGTGSGTSIGSGTGEGGESAAPPPPAAGSGSASTQTNTPAAS